MGRFSSFISKAGDVVQQANEEYQRARQQQQHVHLQGQYGVHEYGQSAQRHTGSPYPPQQDYQQVSYPPPLPPRQTSTTQVYQQTPQQYPASQSYYGHSAAQPQAPSSYDAPSIQQSYNESPQLMRQKLEEQLQWEQQEARRLRQQLEAQLEESKRETERLRQESLAQIEQVRQEFKWQQREYSNAQETERENTNARMPILMAQAEEEMRVSQDMLSQQKAQHGREVSQAESLASEAVERTNIGGPDGHIDYEDKTHTDDVDDELTKQIHELLITQSAPPPPPPRPYHSGQSQATTAVAQQSPKLSSPDFPTPSITAQMPTLSASARPAPDILAKSPQQAQYFPPPPPPPPPPTREINESPGESLPPVQVLDQAPKPHASPSRQDTLERPPSPVVPRSTIPTPHGSGITPALDCMGAPVKIDVDWFVHDMAPDFLVCSRCFVDHIYDTALRDLFTRHRFSDFDKVSRKCFFGTTRVKDNLWPKAVSGGSLGNMLEYMKSRPRVDECPIMSPQENCDWWVAAEIPGLSFCYACWEDGISTGPFATRFQLQKMEQAHTCDAANWFVKRMYEMHTKKVDWETFAAEVKDRLQIPLCPKEQAVAGTERTWFRSKREPEGLQICSACYGDYFYKTPNAMYLQQVELGWENTVCLLGQVNLLVPAQQAISKKDPELFWKCIEEVDKQPFCAAQGITGAAWYTLPNNPVGFGVCGACRAGIAEPFGWSQHLVPKRDVSPTDKLICCFNPAHARFSGFMSILGQIISISTWKPLGDFASIFTNVPVCPRDGTKTLPYRRYWGWDNLHICEDCYLTFAKDTALESSFEMNGEVIENSGLCDIYSPRMRTLYTNACEGRTTLEELLNLAHQRRIVYMQTVPVCQRIIDQQKIMAMQARMRGMMGTTYKLMGGMYDASMGHSYTVGNSYVGHGYANSMLLDGAVYDKQSWELSANVTNGSASFQVRMLEQRWRAVE